jgi:uncharacterized membrane protein YkoI
MHRTHRTLPLFLAVVVSFPLPAFAADTAPKDAKTGAQAAQDTKTDANADAKAQTKVSEADARKTALASVPKGTVQSAKMATDKGRQVWAFELKGESSPNVVIVHVDANSGRIVSKSIKSAAPAAKPKKS